MAEIERLCSAHPVRLPDAPVVTDGFFLASYWVPKPEQVWAAEALLKRGFRFVETDVKTPDGVRYHRLTLSSDAQECAATQRMQGALAPEQRAQLELKLAALGLKTGECVAVQTVAAPTARYRVELVNHSPPRNNWIDGLSGRRDVRTQASFKDVQDQRELADVRSFTVQYQVTVSGSESSGCDRRGDVKRLWSEFIQPAAAPAPRSSALLSAPPAATFPVQSEAPLELTGRSQPGTQMGWRERQKLGELRPPPVPGVGLTGAVSGKTAGWTLHIPVAEGLLAIPLPWVGTAVRDLGYLDQPARIYATPRGVALLLVWRRAERVDKGAVHLTWAEFSAQGAPLLRSDAQLPLDEGINPFNALLALPEVTADAVTLRVTELEREVRSPDGKDVMHPVRRISEYRWRLAR